MSASSRCGLTLTLVLFLWAVAQAQEAEDEVVKVDTSLVTVNVSVTDDKGRHLPGLRAEDFLVTEEGRPVSPAFFDGQGPASVIFVVDISSSMHGTKWRNLKAGMKKFLSAAREANDYTLIAFNDAPQLLARSVSAAELWHSFDGLTPSGHTALYDALLLGLSVLEQAPRRHKALVLLSDGQDTKSRTGLHNVQQEFLAYRAAIYTVGILSHSDVLMTYDRQSKALLKQLADVTGGLVLFPTPGKIDNVLGKINSDLSSQYSLSYYPPDKAPGWRNLQVRLTQDTRSLKIRYQQRYLLR